MKRLDRGRGKLELEDIAHPDFDPARYGKTQDEVMGHIHGVTPSGEIVTGVEVFRQAYHAVGWGWLLGWTAWPVFRSISDAAYSFFAKHRLRLQGRSSVCDDGTCRV